jgi:hypothetical protein
MAGKWRELRLRRVLVHRRLGSAGGVDLQLRLGDPGRVHDDHLSGSGDERRLLPRRRRDVHVLLRDEFVREGRRLARPRGRVRRDARRDGDDGRDEGYRYVPAEGGGHVPLMTVSSILADAASDGSSAGK